MIFGYQTDSNQEYQTIDNYDDLMLEIKQNDTVIIKSLSNLGRSYDEILDEWKKLTKDLGVKIIIQDNPVLNETINNKLVSDIVMESLANICKTTKEEKRKKQMEGLRQAKENGIKLGRPFFVKQNSTNSILDSYINKEITNNIAANMIGVSRATFFRMVKARREELAGGNNV